MVERFDMSLASWGGFNRYMVKDGCIVAGPRAQWRQHSPWTDYFRSVEGGEPPPYLKLFNLIEKHREELEPYLAGAPPSATPLSAPGFAAAVCAWCCNYGLLGLLQQHTLEVALAPRWARIPIGQGRYLLAAITTYYLRSNLQWLEQGVCNLERDRILSGDEGIALVGQPVATEHATLFGTSPGVLCMSWDFAMNRKWDTKPVDEAWAPFFPSIPKEQHTVYPFPKPETEIFWQLYGEPVYLFAHAACNLYRAFEVFTKLPSQDPDVPEMAERQVGFEALDFYLSGIGQTVSMHGNGQIRCGWRSISLLATLAMMVVLDMDRQRRFLRCLRPDCNEWFREPARAHQTRYCSARCRTTVQQRRYRERRINEGKPHAKE